MRQQIVIVDNNSSDKTVTIVKSKYPECVLLKNRENKGFGCANNIGILYALQNDAEHIALLNQDAKLPPNALQMLVQYSQNYPEYGILAPMFCSYDGSELDEYLLKWTFAYNIPMASDIFFQRAKEVYHVPLVPAAMWLIKRAAVEDAGLFDPLFFMYAEDDDMWRRIKRKGWKAGLFPAVIVFHHTSNNSSFTIQRRIWYKYGSNLLELKNPDRSFSRCFLTCVQRYTAQSVSALISLNASELYVSQISFFLLISKIFKIYKHRRASIARNPAFMPKNMQN